MRRPAAAPVLLALVLAGCARSPSQPAPSPAASRPDQRHVALPAAPDPRTATALKHIAQVFNDHYQNGLYPSVYARWDRASQAVISEAGYVRRHTECAASAGAPAVVETVSPGPRDFWLVRYEIGGQQFVDYWTYRAGHWRFDLLRSNPSSVNLYRMSFRHYVKAVGCRT
jgi:hypothetical protein